MVLAHDIEDGSRTEDVKNFEDVSFQSMLLNNNTLVGLQKSGFLKPSPIQLHGIPLGKCGFDLLLEAKSGTGKTAVFSVIALEKLDLNKGTQSIILAPTREIAFQVCDVIKQIGIDYKGLNVQVVIGGMPVQDDLEKLKNRVHIVVGSPGRLRHLIQDKHLDVSSVRLVVLDEADKLMEKSFVTDINYILSLLPKQKQVILSSATYPEESKSFISKYVQNVQLVCPDSNNILIGIKQNVTTVPFHSNIIKQTKNRYEELKKILSQKQFKQCLIFCNYQARVGELYKMLIKDKWPVDQLYGQQVQTERLDALKTLQEYKCRILVSTDLAARGIDASNVDVVINFEPPFEWPTYLHRIGRAGRFGSYGTAISILSEGKEEEQFRNMLTDMNLPINLTNLWTDEPFHEKHSVKTSDVILDEPFVTKEKANADWNTLWQALTSNNVTNEVISFDRLCSSFGETNNIYIESFSDLINSFKIGKHDIDSDYKHVNIEELLLPKQVTQHNLTMNEDEVKFEEECQNSAKSNRVENFDLRNIPLIKPESKLNKENNKLGKHKTNSNKKALLDAGLPTEFSTSHNKKNKVKSNYKKGDVYGPWKPIKEDNYEDDNDTEIFKDRRKTCRYSESKYVKKNRLSSSNSNYELLECSDNFESKAFLQRKNSFNERAERGHQFDIWYSQLKAQMKYIEYSVYLQEISKLYKL